MTRVVRDSGGKLNLHLLERVTDAEVARRQNVTAEVGNFRWRGAELLERIDVRAGVKDLDCAVLADFHDFLIEDCHAAPGGLPQEHLGGPEVIPPDLIAFPESWGDAARIAVETAGKSLKELRVAEIIKLLKIEEGKVVTYRARVTLSLS